MTLQSGLLFPSFIEEYRRLIDRKGASLVRDMMRFFTNHLEILSTKISLKDEEKSLFRHEPPSKDPYTFIGEISLEFQSMHDYAALKIKPLKTLIELLRIRGIASNRRNWTDNCRKRSNAKRKTR